MKRIILIGLSLLMLNFASANDGVVGGQIVDSKTKTPLEFVTVVIKKQNEENAFRGTLTDKTGNFILNNLPYGDYQISISFVGFSTFEQNVTLNANAKRVNLKQIALAEGSEMLQEVQVTGMKSQMKIDIDKKVFNVDQNIASTGGNASDILSNIPSVEVDSEGSVSLRGNSAVTIWINGKASGLSADNRAQILEQLPAESIDKIEVITNPSAKYSPEGTAGIINIVLKENRRAGYFGSVQAGVDSRGGYNAGVNINYSSSKIESNANFGYRNRAFANGGYSNRLNIKDSDTTFLNQTSEGEGNRGNFFTRLGLTYHLTKSDHLSVNGFGMFGGSNNSNEINYLSNSPNSYLSSKRLSSSEGKMLGYNFDIGYKHDFSKTANIDFTAAYNKWGMDEESVYEQNSLYPDSRQTTSYQRQTRIIDPHNWDFQLDYTNAFNKNNKLEAGYKGTLRREKSPVETFAGKTSADAVPIHELFNDFIYSQDVHALYSTYSGRVSNFGYQAGLRAEYLNTEARSLAYGQSENDVQAYKNDYLSLFPTVFLSYSLPEDNEFQLNYTRRISRPWGGQLNSFKNITDSTNISYGNPKLQPEYSNAFELNYIKSLHNHIFSLSAYYRTTENVIQRISYIEDNIMKSTHENIAQTSAAGTEFVVKNRLFTLLDLTTTVNLFYNKINGFTYFPENMSVPIIGKEREDFSWNAKIIANIVIPKIVSLQLTGDYNAEQLSAQGYRKANYTFDAGVRKSFNSISVSLSARDILASRKRHSITSGPGFWQDSQNWRGGRQVSLTVTYNFGNMNSKRPDRSDRRRQENEGYEEGGEF